MKIRLERFDKIEMRKLYIVASKLNSTQNVKFETHVCCV